MTPPPAPPDRRALALIALPLALLAVNSAWLFSPIDRDDWMYYGLFRGAPAYLELFAGNPAYYPASRLSVVLPGWLAHSLLPAILGNVVLHLALYWAALFSFYFVARARLGSRPALLAALLLAGDPFFQQAVGRDHVNSFGIAYFSVALLLVDRAARRFPRRTVLFFAGALAMALVSANVFYAVYLLLLAFHFVSQAEVRPTAADAVAFAGGGSCVFLLLGATARLMGGSPFYFAPSLLWLADSPQTPTVTLSDNWPGRTTGLALCLLILPGSLLAIGRGRRERLAPDNRFGWLAQVEFVGFALLFAVIHLTVQVVLFLPPYVSLLIPPAYLALAGRLAGMTRDLTPKAYGRLLVLAGATSLAVAALAAAGAPGVVSRLPTRTVDPLVIAVAAGAPVALVLLRRRGSALGLAVLIVGLGFSQVVADALHRQTRRRPLVQSAAAFRQMDRALSLVQSGDRKDDVWLWFDRGSDGQRFGDALSTAHFCGAREVNTRFPELSPADAAGSRFRAGSRIAILSPRPDAFTEGARALARLGWRATWQSTQSVPGPIADIVLTTLIVEPGSISN